MDGTTSSIGPIIQIQGVHRRRPLGLMVASGGRWIKPGPPPPPPPGAIYLEILWRQAQKERKDGT